MSKPLVAILTASSKTGSYCIQEIYARYLDKVRVRGVFRSDEKAAPFRTKYPDMEIVTGIDATKPETLGQAFVGAQAAFIVTPYNPMTSTPNDRLSLNMIESAVASGVKYIAFLSAFKVTGSQLAFGQYYAGEQLLEKLAKEKGVKYTVLRAGEFLENLLQVFKRTKDTGVLFMPSMLNPAVTACDVGYSAAACLADDAPNYNKHNGKCYELSGPVRVSGPEIAASFGRVAGKEIKFHAMTEEEINQFIPPGMKEIFVEIHRVKDLLPMTDHVKQLTGKSTDIDTWVKANEKYFDQEYNMWG